MKFAIWQEELKAYLEMQDSRFRAVLLKIEEYTVAIDAQAGLDIALSLGIVNTKEALDRNLMGYLKTFTSGEAVKLVTKMGKERIYEAYRLLCEAGRSRRPEHIAGLRLRVQQPRQGVPLAQLMTTILDWEKDLEYCEKVHESMGKTFCMDEEDKRLHLVNMRSPNYW